MTLRLLPPAADDEGSADAEVSAASHTSAAASHTLARKFSASAPASPGPLPEDLRAELRRNEALIWWDEHLEIQRLPIIWTACGSALMLAMASLIAPEFWLRPVAELWRPVAVLCLPIAVVGLREYFNRCALMLTDEAWVRISRNGSVERLPTRSTRRIAKDWYGGGILLEGPPGRIRIPAPLTTRAQKALAAQSRLRPFDSGDQRPIDTAGWLPRN